MENYHHHPPPPSDQAHDRTTPTSTHSQHNTIISSSSSSSSSSTAKPSKLRKQPPPVSYNNHKLRRAPSAPTYPSFTSAPHHNPLGSPPASSHLPGSASSSLHRNPSKSPVDEVGAHVGTGIYLQSASTQSPPASSSQHSLTDQRPTPELIGAPFDAQAIYSNIQSTATQSSHPPPRPAYTQPVLSVDPSRLNNKKSPKLRQSASFTALARKMESITPPRSDGGTKSPRQRYSDEGETAKKRKSDGGKKKGAFSSFVNSMLGSPRRPTISTPTNPMHVTHVSIDNETGEYTVRDTSRPIHCLLLSSYGTFEGRLGRFV